MDDAVHVWCQHVFLGRGYPPSEISDCTDTGSVGANASLASCPTYLRGYRFFYNWLRESPALRIIEKEEQKRRKHMLDHGLAINIEQWLPRQASRLVAGRNNDTE